MAHYSFVESTIVFRCGSLKGFELIGKLRYIISPSSVRTRTQSRWDSLGSAISEKNHIDNEAHRPPASTMRFKTQCIDTIVKIVLSIIAYWNVVHSRFHSFSLPLLLSTLNFCSVGNGTQKESEAKRMAKNEKNEIEIVEVEPSVISVNEC